MSFVGGRHGRGRRQNDGARRVARIGAQALGFLLLERVRRRIVVFSVLVRAGIFIGGAVLNVLSSLTAGLCVDLRVSLYISLRVSLRLRPGAVRCLRLGRTLGRL